MTTHSSILTWEILWTEGPGGYSPWGLKSVRHELATNQQQQQGFIQKHTQNKDIYWMIEENVTRGSQEPDPVFPVRAAIQYLLIHSCLEY